MNLTDIKRSGRTGAAPRTARSFACVFALVLSTVVALLPCLAHAGETYEYYIPCSGRKAVTEGRTVDIRSYLKVNTVGMLVSDIENLYCVTHVKCVALGYCKAGSADEQAAAERLKPEIAAEEARLRREREAKAQQAEREREAAEEERKRKEAAEIAEKTRRENLIAAEAQRLRLSRQEAKQLMELRDVARSKMPPLPANCTRNYPAYSQKLDFTQVIMVQAKAEKDYATFDRDKMCNGHPGTLDPLQCQKMSDFFGLKFASCSATMRCPARQETLACVGASSQ